MTRSRPSASTRCCKRSHPVRALTSVSGCPTDRVSTRPRLPQGVLPATGHQMASCLPLASSMVQSWSKTRLVESYSPSISAKVQFGLSLFAHRNLKPLTICSWLVPGIKNSRCTQFKGVSRPNPSAMRKTLVSTHARFPSFQKVTIWLCLAATRRSPSGIERECSLALSEKWTTGSGRHQ